MGFRFRQSVRLFPGVRLNFSRSGVSTSVGVRGASVTLGARGLYGNVGIPGSGVSYRTRLDKPAGGTTHAERQTRGQEFEGANPYQVENVTASRSADVSVLTSAGLSQLKRLINEAAARRITLLADIDRGEQRLAQAKGRLHLAERFVVRLFTEKAIPRLVASANSASELLAEGRSQLEGCAVDVDFAFDDETRDSYAALVKAFESLRTTERIWDVTATADIDQVTQRTAADGAAGRMPVTFDFSESPIIRTQHRILRLGNDEDRDLQILPGFVLMRDATGDFALIAFADLECRFSTTRVVEQGAVPLDAERAGSTWLRANKDGSRDRRFNDNYEIPIVRYGTLDFTSPAGLAESYHISSRDKAAAFAEAMSAHQHALANLNSATGGTPALPAVSNPSVGRGDDNASDLPAFRAKPRRNLAADWIILVAAIIGLAVGPFWVSQHWPRPAPTAPAPPPIVVAPVEVAPVVEPPPAKPPVKHKTRPRRVQARRTIAEPSPISEPVPSPGDGPPFLGVSEGETVDTAKGAEISQLLR